MGVLELMREFEDAEVPEGFDDRVIAYFGGAYLRIFENQKLQYIRDVLKAQHRSHAELANLLGYSNRSAINAIEDGRISLDQFDKFQAILGGNVPWPSPTERKTLALMETMAYVRHQELGKPPSKPLDHESFDSLVFILSSSDWIQAEIDGDVKSLARLAHQWLTVVHARLGTNTLNDLADLQNALAVWGLAYLLSRDALPSTKGMNDGY